MKGNRITLNSSTNKNVLKTAKEQNIKIKSFCKIGMCGRCTVKVISGDVSKPTNREIKKLGQKRLSDGYRLACQTEFVGKLTLEV